MVPSHKSVAKSEIQYMKGPLGVPRTCYIFYRKMIIVVRMKGRPMEPQKFEYIGAFDSNIHRLFAPWKVDESRGLKTESWR